MRKLLRLLFEFCTGTKLQTKSSNKSDANGQISIQGTYSNGLDDTYLFDFKNLSSAYNGVTFFDTTPQNNFVVGGTFIGVDSSNEAKPPAKIKIKPIDVLHELETIPTPFGLTGLDEKISILHDKAKLITQHYSKREVTSLIERLENRKKYPEFKEFFEKYQNTSDEKIDKLLEKYELVMKTSDIFVPEFPDEAIKAMTDYTEKLEAICKKKPVFYVIAEAKDFKKAYEKRDPILLVQSPFGFYWQILGAWDKEMLLLSEL
jgi:hypothetical protein